MSVGGNFRLACFCWPWREPGQVCCFVRDQHGLKLDQLRLRNHWPAAVRAVGAEQAVGRQTPARMNRAPLVGLAPVLSKPPSFEYSGTPTCLRAVGAGAWRAAAAWVPGARTHQYPASTGGTHSYPASNARGERRGGRSVRRAANSALAAPCPAGRAPALSKPPSFEYSGASTRSRVAAAFFGCPRRDARPAPEGFLPDIPPISGGVTARGG
jgi:hypothetical protein